MKTEASNGLRKALARAGDGSVSTIAEMQTDDLLAAMSDEQKAAMAAKFTPATPAASAQAEEDEPEDQMGEEGKDKKEGDNKMAAAAHDRIKAVAKAVAEDESCKGKADLALQMLADDDYAGLSASGIVKLLGKQGAASSAADTEAAARAEMREQIEANAGGAAPSANNGAGAATDETKAAASVWDSALANIIPATSGAR